MFTPVVTDKLKYYVYRLIDPRNGETFYVGKGIGNRVFAHAKGEPEIGNQNLNDKVQRIRDIRLGGFEVAHVIHRHGMDEETAFEVEAALIDAYSGAANLVGGRYSDERGVMHSKQVIERYEAKEAEFRHKVIAININQSALERGSVYEAVRYAWRIDPKKAVLADYILAVQQGLIIGVFVAEKWLPAAREYFPSVSVGAGRYGFIGREAPEEIVRFYLRHRIPDRLRKRGAANPIRYITA